MRTERVRLSFDVDVEIGDDDPRQSGCATAVQRQIRLVTELCSAHKQDVPVLNAILQGISHGANADGTPVVTVRSELNDELPPLTIAEVERRAIVAALDRHNWHVTDAARSLGVGRSTLYRRLNELNLHRRTP